MKKINSLSNLIVRNLIKLKKSSERKKQGLVIVDGRREIEEAFKNNWACLNLFYCSDLDKKKVENNKQFFALEAYKIIEVSKEIFLKICYKENPDGYLALIKTKQINLSDIKVNKESLILVLENVEKPGNLGAIIRTATAVGVSVIIVNDNQTDIYNPNVIRSSEGHIFSQIVIGVSVKETIKWLKENKIKSFGAATGNSNNYTKVDLRDKMALVLGSEANGLSPEWLKGADQLIKIPMLAGVDSLNVSVSAAVILFEVLRQREK